MLRLEDQDGVAAASGTASADELMADIADAARSIAWIADDAWRHVSRHQLGHEERVGPGLLVVDREIELHRERRSRRPTRRWCCGPPAPPPQRDIRLARSTLDRLADEVDPQAWAGRWPDGALDELVALLRQGHRAIDVFEALDQRGLLVRLLPEWATVRSRPQRNAYHRFTVDRHLWEATANAAELTDRVTRPDLLVLGALFHDLGKGYPGDHTDAGMELMATIGPRLGLAAGDVGDAGRA